MAWKGTPGQWAAIRKAQAASVRARRKIRLANPKNRGRAPKRVNRGIGVAGAKRNFTPYIRVNKRSQTIGYNTGTIIKGTNRRIVTGKYVRIETTTKKTPLDTALGNVMKKVAPQGTKRGYTRDYFKKNVVVTNPAIRAVVGRNAEVRLGTSRKAGPTIIVRRGKHKISEQAAKRAIRRYDTNARKLNSKKKVSKPRPQRRNAKK